MLKVLVLCIYPYTRMFQKNLHFVHLPLTVDNIIGHLSSSHLHTLDVAFCKLLFDPVNPTMIFTHTKYMMVASSTVCPLVSSDLTRIVARLHTGSFMLASFLAKFQLRWLPSPALLVCAWTPTRSPLPCFSKFTRFRHSYTFSNNQKFLWKGCCSYVCIHKNSSFLTRRLSTHWAERRVDRATYSFPPFHKVVLILHVPKCMHVDSDQFRFQR